MSNHFAERVHNRIQTVMLKSGKELKVFAIQNKDLQKFTEQAKRYGVLYCVLRDKSNSDPNATMKRRINVRMLRHLCLIRLKMQSKSYSCSLRLVM